MIYIFLANGFEEIEALTPVDVLRRGGAEVVTVGVGSRTIKGSHGITVTADIEDSQLTDFTGAEAVVLPGGMPGTLNLEKSEYVQAALEYCWENGIHIAAICAAPLVYGSLGLLKGKNATCYPGFEQELKGANCLKKTVVCDKNFITGCGPGATFALGHAIVSALISKEKADTILQQMMFQVYD